LQYLVAGSVGVLVVVAAVGIRQLWAPESTDGTATKVTDVSPASVEPAGPTDIGDAAPGPKAPAVVDDAATAAAIGKPAQPNRPEAGLFDNTGPAESQPAKAPDVAATAPVVATPTDRKGDTDTVAGAERTLKPGRVDSKDLPLGPLLSPSVLVEKGALRLTVFDGDAGIKSYRVAVGAVRGDKQIEGDRKTPEGDFYICVRKTKGRTPYTRSMGLSYPNLEDADRGIQDGLINAAQKYAIAEAIKKKQKPPWRTRLGGAIMIHGKREGRTGTLGCIAMDDDDAIELYDRLPLNTPVRVIP